ncbi:autotransporter domain-containing protein [Roseixanthobacter glucoisosaccharinicivorans]|uniref:autotransporter domain-containing protein n=1 Tax=Roseixanthobacter glucoisosaccharinicivorans TaxID=3119923 RepID=UPI00372743B4
MAVLSVLTASSFAAHAADGDGGAGGTNLPISIGGSASATAAGGDGTDGSGTDPGNLSGGAGGGSGLTGGNGGSGANIDGGFGGAGASAAGDAGSDGTAGGNNSSGGGGGGGAHAFVGLITDLPTSGTLTGGAGGNGGAAGFAGYGGGGGGGGFGAVVTGLTGSGGAITVSAAGGAGGGYGWAGVGGNGGSGLLIYQPTGDNLITITGSSITGGAGGSGINASWKGGDGGSGLVLSGGTGNTGVLISGGSITGGDAGTGVIGSAGGNGILVENTSGVTSLGIATSVTGGTGTSGIFGVGAGGAGIQGANLAVSIAAGGSVTGGLGGNGVRAAALNFVDGTNSLTLASGATLTGDIVVATNTTTLEFAQSTNYTLSSVISGNGSISKTGAGTLILTGANTYTGGTTISAGTLQIGDGGTTGSITGDVTNNAALAFNRSDAVTYSGIISGTGSLTQAGGGTLILTGANTYSGGTTISAGTLQIGDGGATGSITGNVTNNGTLVFNHSGSDLFLGNISGSGQVVKEGSGSQTLSGTNTYTGGTTINAGTLQVSSDEALGAASGSLTLNGGTLSTSGTFTSSRSVILGSNGGTLSTASGVLTVSGVISGSGGLTIEGGAPTGVILTGNNTYTGTTTVNGALAIGYLGNSGSVAGDIVVNPNAVLLFARSDSYNVANSITSAVGSSLGFTGGGTYTYSGGGSINGQVLVQGATLRLTGSEFATASSMNLSLGGTLSGNGTVSSLVVGDGGIVAPGNSPGTIAASSVSFGNGSLYRVDVTPAGAHDLITATGAVTINGGAAVQVVAQPGRYAVNSSYAIITTTGTLTGTFGSVTSDYAFLTPSLSYDAQNVYLLLHYAGVDFATYAQTPNQAGTAMAAQALGAGNSVFDALVQQTATSAPGAFNALSGEAYASTGTVLQQQAVYVRDAVGGRLRQALTAPGVVPLAYGAGGPQTAALGEGLTPTLWAQGYGGWGNSFSNGNAASISNSIGGFLIGLDVAVAPNVRGGLFGGFSQSKFDVPDRSSSGSIDNYDIGLYAGAQFGALALRGGAAYTWHDVSATRTVAFPGFWQSADGGYTTGTAQVFGEAGYEVAVGAYAFEPFAGLAYVNVAGGSFLESGGAAALSVSTGGMDTVYSTLGLRVATTMQAWGRTLTPHATLGWQHAFGDTTPTSAMQFLGGTSPFSVSGVPIAEDALLLEAGLSYAFSEKATFGVSYTSQLASTAAQNAFTAQFALKF